MPGYWKPGAIDIALHVVEDPSSTPEMVTSAMETIQAFHSGEYVERGTPGDPWIDRHEVQRQQERSEKRKQMLDAIAKHPMGSGDGVAVAGALIAMMQSGARTHDHLVCVEHMCHAFADLGRP